MPPGAAAGCSRRDGDRVSALLEYAGPDRSSRLTIRLQIDLGPPIQLAGGKFECRQNGESLEGKVEASSIEFQAGQSGGMGLSGRFVLQSTGAAKSFRVILPPTLMGYVYH